MVFLLRRREWGIPESQVTSEAAFFDRRAFLRSLGLGGIAAGALLSGCLDVSRLRAADTDPPEGGPRVDPDPPGGKALYPARRNPAFADGGRPLSPETIPARYNNFYEFTTDKEQVWQLVEKFETRPWTVEITGLCNKPQTLGLDDLVRKMPLEERIYRHRCVEAWSMTVPWTGFPYKALLDLVEPMQSARFVRMVSFFKPEQAPGQKTQVWYPWPYYEGLSLQEASNELAFLVTGVYGHALPKQHGAPIRLATPWKYGYKSIKSIVRMELVEKQPKTFWNDIAPDEYGFVSNVDPDKPHPRWSQATERLVDTGERIPTQLYNGYGKWVADLYKA
jgi:methionine sulfoxide reductase catalytic subunit